ncbi:MAG TPA: hypothetical protein VFP72_23420 [Kineosporiaceae bacterium]|nr:hypothetical protein [Kineosporiaceae bacterium]
MTDAPTGYPHDPYHPGRPGHPGQPPWTAPEAPPVSAPGHPAAGYPAQAYPAAGYPAHAHPAAAYPTAGAYPPQGHPGASHPPAGYPPQAYPAAGHPAPGYPVQPTAGPAPGVMSPELDRIRTAHAARDWPALRQGIQALPTADERMVACTAVCAHGDEEFYRSVLAAHPQDPLAMTLLGYTLLVTGWAIRGGGWANTVSREQFAAFQEYLHRADAVLIDALARQPQLAEAWAVRVTVARGLQLSPAEARRRYQQAVRHAPHLLAAQLSLLQKLLPKWSGSWEAAEEFVRTCVAEAPPGAPNIVLVAELHLERMLGLSAAQRKEYFARPEVRTQILDAARRGPLAPDFRPGLRAKSVYNTFALVLALIEEYAGAAHCFQALAGQMSDAPWDYLGQPMEQFVLYRDRCLREARR